MPCINDESYALLKCFDNSHYIMQRGLAGVVDARRIHCSTGFGDNRAQPWIGRAAERLRASIPQRYNKAYWAWPQLHNFSGDVLISIRIHILRMGKQGDKRFIGCSALNGSDFVCSFSYYG